jgi:hypothetical protein
MTEIEESPNVKHFEKDNGYFHTLNDEDDYQSYQMKRSPLT